MVKISIGKFQSMKALFIKKRSVRKLTVDKIKSKKHLLLIFNVSAYQQPVQAVQQAQRYYQDCDAIITHFIIFSHLHLFSSNFKIIMFFNIFLSYQIFNKMSRHPKNIPKTTLLGWNLFIAGTGFEAISYS